MYISKFFLETYFLEPEVFCIPDNACLGYEYYKKSSAVKYERICFDNILTNLFYLNDVVYEIILDIT